MHLKNLERILKYTLKETSRESVIDTLHDKTKFTIEQHITQRDVENFVAYLKFVSESEQGQKVFKLERKLVQNYADRIYSDYNEGVRSSRTDNLYLYFENKLGKNIVLNDTELNVIYKKLTEEKRASIDKVMNRVCIAMILKWLQGFLQTGLSKDLHNHIIFLASIYGLYGSNRVFNVDWQPYNVSENDAALISSEYRFFETAITDAIKDVKEALVTTIVSRKPKDQFRIVLSSVDNLIKMSKKGLLESRDAFIDKIIIAASLIYLQDEFVKKDAELTQFINLIVGFYRQFRDKRYIAVLAN